MSDLIKRMNATLAMGVIAPRSSAHEYTIAESQFREAANEIERLTAKTDADERMVKNCKGAVVIAQEWIAEKDDKIERLQARVEMLEEVKEAAQCVLECLYFHGFEPGEDPRISNLAGAMMIADGTLTATEQGESDE